MRTDSTTRSRSGLGGRWKRWPRADRCRKTSSAWSGRRRFCCGKSWRRQKRSGNERGWSSLSGIGRRASGRLSSSRRSRDERRRSSLRRRIRRLLRHLHLSVASSSVSDHRLQRQDQHHQRAKAEKLRRRSRNGCRGVSPRLVVLQPRADSYASQIPTEAARIGRLACIDASWPVHNCPAHSLKRTCGLKLQVDCRVSQATSIKLLTPWKSPASPSKPSISPARPPRLGADEHPRRATSVWGESASHGEGKRPVI